MARVDEEELVTFGLDDAMDIAEKAHTGQTRHGGGEYIHHVRRVVEMVQGVDAKIVAALHDVVEDSEITLGHLKHRYQVPDHIVEAVNAITKRKCNPCEGRGWEWDPGPMVKLHEAIHDVTLVDFNHQTTEAIAEKIGYGRKTCAECKGAGSEKRDTYLDRVKKNSLARMVKIADARDNMMDDSDRKGMRQRYEWTLRKLGVEPYGCCHTFGDKVGVCKYCGLQTLGGL